MTPENCNNLGSIEGVEASDVFKYDPEKNLFTLKNVKLKAIADKNAIENEGIEGLKIEFEGENILRASNSIPLNINSNTELKGNGKLIIQSDVSAGIKIQNSASPLISGITLEATGKYGIEGEGKEKIEVKSATVTLKGNESVTKDLVDFKMEGCDIVEPLGGMYDAKKKTLADYHGGLLKVVKITPVDVYKLRIGKVLVTSANCNLLHKIPCVESAGEFKYAPMTKTLTMKNVKSDVGYWRNIIENEGIDGLTIVLEGENTLNAGNGISLNLYGNTTLSGKGKLTIESNVASGILLHNLASLQISETTLDVSGKHGIEGEGKEKVVVTKATVTLTGLVSATQQLDNFKMTGSFFIAPSEAVFDTDKKAIVNGKKEIVTSVKIEPIVFVDHVTLSSTTLQLEVDDTNTLVATIEPKNATNQQIIWSTSNDKVATVVDGVVKAVGCGKAEIKVTTKDGNKTATCEVTVLPTLQFKPSSVSVDAGQQIVLALQQVGFSASEKIVLTSSADGVVKIVDNDALKVEGVMAGKATITATVAANETHNEISATCEVTVTIAAAIVDTLFADVLVAPNPFNNQLRIVNRDLRGTYALLNAQGIMVASGVLDSAETCINTASLPAGVYFLRLTAANGANEATKTFTVVKR